MHFPPYYKRPEWQRFIIGILVGGLVSYFVLIYMYGVMYEELLAENYELREEIIDLRQQNKALLESQENQDTARTIEAIEITISNPNVLKNDSLLVSQLKTLIKEEVSHLIGNDILNVSSSVELLISAIENKAFTIDSVTYHFSITRLIIDSKLIIAVEGKVAN
ncbi:sporulation membrane protein YtrI [Oceanobacillus alkalisoli]|uniref:sporulation membrane protein YtrI n=1 Tax=Oceanobacillus alkalisoli TaxID=2925113 RepID=UPI001EF01826|nr:sporulation membrane protein YtrI [Oceanobacillus alkalisoli]MCF3943349.1 hypothetical protein [Oceanobacillus alkalisoli]MCG5105290.1 hypothetical protein [Oceanobacillus alkalisoli]